MYVKCLGIVLTYFYLYRPLDFLFSFLFERLSQQQLVTPRNSITIVGTLKFTTAKNKNGGYSNKRKIKEIKE